MSDIHAETAPLVCATTKCTCEIAAGTGYRDGDRVYCNERCADKNMDGCGHDDCPCNEQDVAVPPTNRAS